MKSWAEIGFEIETTADGSPSLRLLESVDPTQFRGESMHHSGGAWTETSLIYGRPAEEILKTQLRPHFLVVGLGMGYIELTIAREALLAKKDVGLITSFESVPELRDYFWSWLHDHQEDLHGEVWNTYEWMAKHVVEETDLKVAELKSFLQKFFPLKSSINSELSSSSSLPSRYHGIMYDLFSAKTTPMLWEENFLKHFLKTGTAMPAWFSTYACRVSLKNALYENGFEVVVRAGFRSKRNSTLGIKKDLEKGL